MKSGRLGLVIAMAAAVALSAPGVPSALGQQLPAPQPAAAAMPNAVPAPNTPAVNNGDVRAIAKVGTTMVIGGTFTQVNGLSRPRIAAFNASTGALTSFAPNINGQVSAIIPGPTANTVYVGGAFTTIGVTAVQKVALLDLTNGSIVSSFNPVVIASGNVNDLFLRGNRLYLAGSFWKVGGVAHKGLAALNASTGAVDPFMNIQLSGHHNDTGGGAQGAVGPWGFDVSPAGDRMVVQGNFKFANGLLRDQVVMIDLTGATASVRTDWSTNRYSPYCFNWAFDSYVRGVSFSPDGSYLVISATGGPNPGTLCDASARFETYTTGTDLEPTWVVETGGDTVWATEITDSAVFVGGHQRWANNPNGQDSAGAGAVPRPGLMALDPISGRPLQWNPGRNPPGKSVYAILATSEGVWIGSNTDWIGNRKYNRPKIALFPYQGGTPVVSTAVGQLPGSLFLGGTQSTAGSNVLYRVNAGGPTFQSTDGGPDWTADDGGSNPLRNDGSNTASYAPVGNIDLSVPTTTPAGIFDTERWDPGVDPEMEWQFPVTAGTPVEVRLFLSNRCDCTQNVGQRIFDVTLNGQPWLTDEDIVADVGDDRGTMKKITLNAPPNGIVSLGFVHKRENPLVNGVEILRTDIAPPPPGANDVLNKIDFDGSTATNPSPVNNGGVAWSQTRGAFMVGNNVFYGYTDGFLYSRTYNGTTFGPAVKIDPYHDPVWANVDNNLGGTFNGASPSLYSQMPNVTGMFYTNGHLYYTLYGDSNLHWRWFSPDSGIVDERSTVVPSSVSFSNADGMFISGGSLYYVTKSDGALHKVAFVNGSVTGSSSVVSSPATDGVNWTNRSLFLLAG